VIIPSAVISPTLLLDKLIETVKKMAKKIRSKTTGIIKTVAGSIKNIIKKIRNHKKRVVRKLGK